MAIFSRILTALIAMALLAAAVIGLAEILLAALDRPSWIVPRDDWAGWLREHAWTGSPVRAALAGLLVVGLLLLLAGLRRGRPSALPLPSTTPDVQMTASRRSVEKVIATAVRGTDGVTNADASARRRRLKVTADTRLRDPGDLQQRVTAAVEDRLRQVGLADTLAPTIRVNRKEVT